MTVVPVRRRTNWCAVAEVANLPLRQWALEAIELTRALWEKRHFGLKIDRDPNVTLFLRPNLPPLHSIIRIAGLQNSLARRRAMRAFVIVWPIANIAPMGLYAIYWRTWMLTAAAVLSAYTMILFYLWIRGWKRRQIIERIEASGGFVRFHWESLSSLPTLDLIHDWCDGNVHEIILCASIDLSIIDTLAQFPNLSRVILDRPNEAIQNRLLGAGRAIAIEIAEGQPR